MDERFGISAFEYVEYMENYKHLFDDSGNPIPDDVIEKMIATHKYNDIKAKRKIREDYVNKE